MLGSLLLLLCVEAQLSVHSKIPLTAFESSRLDEEPSFQAIDNLMNFFADKEWIDNYPVAPRALHGKQQGLVFGSLEILDDIPLLFKRGIFAQPELYETWLRFSQANSASKDDREPDAHGLGLKIMGVKGARLVEEFSDHNMDLTFATSSSRFTSRNSAEFASTFSGLIADPTAEFTYHADWASVFMEVFGGDKIFCGNFFHCNWYALTPFQLGREHENPLVVHYRLSPCDLREQAVDSSDPNYIQKRLVEDLGPDGPGGCFFLQVQAQGEDKLKFPVEEAHVAWDETVSPFVSVGKISILPQDILDRAHCEFGENLNFNVWRTTDEHRPLGSVNRARLRLYYNQAQKRHDRMNTNFDEPTPHTLKCPFAAKKNAVLACAKNETGCHHWDYTCKYAPNTKQEL